MCGFVGIINKDGKIVNSSLLKSMASVIHHSVWYKNYSCCLKLACWQYHLNLVSLNINIASMNSPEIKQFIDEHSNLFWYTPNDKKEEISNEFLVETILNYGDINAIMELFNLLGIKKVAKIFFDSITLSNRRKGNYHELTINYFTLVFRKYAH